MRLLLSILALLALGAVAAAQGTASLPPVTGAIEPRIVPKRSDDGLYHQAWAVTSFLDLRDDFAEAKAAGKRFAVIFEQRGCIYCTRMHTEVLAQRYINDYVRENFAVLQLDLFGAREVTDFDGKKLSEAKLAERWGVMFTPTVVFFKDELPADKAAWGPALEVTRMKSRLWRCNLLRLVRVGARQDLRAGPELPAVPYRPHGRARQIRRGSRIIRIAT